MTQSPVSDLVTFLRFWMRSPKLAGALAPSGRALSDLITRDIAADTGPILELGPGTGVFTHAMIERGVREENLTLVEFAPEFIPMLQERFPKARILLLDASKIGRSDLVQQATYGAVVSGLPLLNLPTRKIMAILEGAFDVLRPGGGYYQFTYGPRCPVSRRLLDRLGLRARKIGNAVLNIPPASVYRISHRRRRA